MTTIAYKGDRIDDVLQVLEAHGGAMRAISDRLDGVEKKIDKLDAKLDAMHSSLAARLDRLLMGTGR